jgi:hypothetical protein
VSPTAFERITGHEVRLSQVGSSFNATCLCNCGKRASYLQACGPTESAALTSLVNMVYRHHSRVVVEKQRWRCAECGAKGVPLEIDHIVPRSKGRDDRVSNLRALCAGNAGCQAHRIKHEGR